MKKIIALCAILPAFLIAFFGRLRRHNNSFFRKTFTLFTLVFLLVGFTQNVFAQSANTPIYVEMTEGSNKFLKKVTQPELEEFLLNNEFMLEYKVQTVPPGTCSLRGENGDTNFGILDFQDRARLNMALTNPSNGQGSFSAQSNGNRVTFSFDIEKIVQNNGLLILNISGDGRLGRAPFNIENGQIIFNKLDQTVTLDAGDLLASDMDASVIAGCFDFQLGFWLLTPTAQLAESRSIEEISQVLLMNQQIEGNFEGIRRLLTDFWWALLATQSMMS